MRDLGVDCALGRVMTRMRRRQRKQKLLTLKPLSGSCRLRLFRGSVCSSLMWRHQAQSFPPSRINWLRRAVGYQVGLHNEVTLDAASHKVKDPWADVVSQHAQSWFIALDRWGPATPLARVWEQQAAAFKEGIQSLASRKGPLTATVGHLIGIKWEVSQTFVWQNCDQTESFNITDPCDRARVLQAIRDDVQSECSRRIAHRMASPKHAVGLDWLVGRRLLAQFQAKGDTLRAKGLMAVWQGSLVCRDNSPVKVCPMCHEDASWKHILFDCRWWENQSCELPSWYEMLKLALTRHGCEASEACLALLARPPKVAQVFGRRQTRLTAQGSHSVLMQAEDPSPLTPDSAELELVSLVLSGLTESRLRWRRSVPHWRDNNLFIEVSFLLSYCCFSMLKAKLIAPLSVLVSTRSSVANVMGSFMLTFVNRFGPWIRAGCLRFGLILILMKLVLLKSLGRSKLGGVSQMLLLISFATPLPAS